MAVFDLLKSATIDFTQIQSGRKIAKFPHCKLATLIFSITVLSNLHSYLLWRKGDPTFPIDTGLLYSKHRTSASWASILHNSSINWMSWIRTFPARSPEARCFPSGLIRMHRTPFFWSYTVLVVSFWLEASALEVSDSLIWLRSGSMYNVLSKSSL